MGLVRIAPVEDEGNGRRGSVKDHRVDDLLLTGGKLGKAVNEKVHPLCCWLGLQELGQLLVELGIAHEFTLDPFFVSMVN